MPQKLLPVSEEQQEIPEETDQDHRPIPRDPVDAGISRFSDRKPADRKHTKKPANPQQASVSETFEQKNIEEHLRQAQWVELKDSMRKGKEAIQGGTNQIKQGVTTVVSGLRSMFRGASSVMTSAADAVAEVLPEAPEQQDEGVNNTQREKGYHPIKEKDALYETDPSIDPSTAAPGQKDLIDNRARGLALQKLKEVVEKEFHDFVKYLCQDTLENRKLRHPQKQALSQYISAFNKFYMATHGDDAGSFQLNRKGSRDDFERYLKAAWGVIEAQSALAKPLRFLFENLREALYNEAKPSEPKKWYFSSLVDRIFQDHRCLLERDLDRINGPINRVMRALHALYMLEIPEKNVSLASNTNAKSTLDALQRPPFRMGKDANEAKNYLVFFLKIQQILNALIEAYPPIYIEYLLQVRDVDKPENRERFLADFKEKKYTVPNARPLMDPEMLENYKRTLTPVLLPRGPGLTSFLEEMIEDQEAFVRVVEENGYPNDLTLPTYDFEEKNSSARVIKGKCKGPEVSLELVQRSFYSRLKNLLLEEMGHKLYETKYYVQANAFSEMYQKYYNPQEQESDKYRQSYERERLKALQNYIEKIDPDIKKGNWKYYYIRLLWEASYGNQELDEEAMRVFIRKISALKQLVTYEMTDYELTYAPADVQFYHLHMMQYFHGDVEEFKNTVDALIRSFYKLYARESTRLTKKPSLQNKDIFEVEDVRVNFHLLHKAGDVTFNREGFNKLHKDFRAYEIKPKILSIAEKNEYLRIISMNNKVRDDFIRDTKKLIKRQENANMHEIKPVVEESGWWTTKNFYRFFQSFVPNRPSWLPNIPKPQCLTVEDDEDEEETLLPPPLRSN